MLLIIITALALAAQALLTLVVLLKDTKALRNRAFFFLSLSLMAWAAVNFASETFPEIAKNIYVIRSILFFAALQNCFFVLFTYSLGGYKFRLTPVVGAYLLLGLSAAVLTLSPFIFSELNLNDKGVIYPTVLPGMVVFALHAFVSIALGFRFLLQRLKGSTGAFKQQLIYILVGSLVLWGIVPVTNFVLSLALQTSFFASFSPLYALAFSGVIAYAIIRHKLFDVRFAIARAAAYLMALFSIVAIYITTGFSIIGLFFSDSQITFAQNVVYIVLAVLLTFTYNPIKRFFDRVTDRIFFRSDYKLETVIDQLGTITVDEIDLKKIEAGSQEVLGRAIRASFLAFVVFPHDDQRKPQYFGITNKQAADVTVLMDTLNATLKGRNVIRRAQLRERTTVRRLMDQLDIEIIVRMKTRRELNGYIVVGSKQNGSLYTNKDMQLLSTAADELALAIQNALRFEEIRDFNKTLQRRINEATSQLRRSNTKLQQLDEAKDDFISMASHQLRTPLTSVKGYLSMVLEGDAGEMTPAQRKLLEEAYGGAQRMVYLIGDFLNVSRMKTGKFMLEYANTNLAEIINEEIGQLRATAERRSLQLFYESPEAFPTVRLDETKMRQVIMNLIDNAIYYSRPGGTIRVELFVKNAHIVFRVKDEGIGVPAAQQKDLFEKFFRASNARKVRPDGTGIGLFMIKKVVLAHGGGIIFNSAENQGSTFGFSVPITPVKPAKRLPE